MNATLKITKIGNAAGIILPKEVLAQLGAEVGETLSVISIPHGIELIAKRDESGEQLAVAKEVGAAQARANGACGYYHG